MGQNVAIKFLGLILWKFRKQLPNLEIELTVEDMAHFNTAMALQGVRAIVQTRATAKGVIVRLADESGLKEIRNPPDSGDDALKLLNDARDSVPGLVRELAVLIADAKEAPQTANLATRLMQTLVLLGGVQDERNNVPELFHGDRKPQSKLCPDGHICENNCQPGVCVRQVTGDMVRH
jgi:hypothetical protein